MRKNSIVRYYSELTLRTIYDLRWERRVPKQPDSKVPLVKQENTRPELNTISDVISLKNNEEIGTKDKRQIENALQMMIPKSVIESAILIDTNGGVLAQSGPQIDNSLLKKLASMISLEGDDEFKNRISIEQADKKIVAVRVGSMAILVVVTSADTAIGMLLVMLNKSVEKIKEILIDAGA